MTRMERSDLLRSAPTHTFYLKYTSQASDENEIYTALRNALDLDVRSFMVASQRAIIVRGLPDDIALATQLLSELDRPRDAYRLTYTLTDFDSTRRLSSQHYVLAAMDGQQTELKQGSKVSVETGTYNVPSADIENQFAYINVGLSFDATVTAVNGGATLKSAVEQSSLADDKPAPAGQNPLIRQTLLEGVYLVPLGKPTPLGTLDLPGTTHHLEIEVLLEKAP
jgi:type II secretory pathway component GspD/PulD (secretin)